MESDGENLEVSDGSYAPWQSVLGGYCEPVPLWGQRGCSFSHLARLCLRNRLAPVPTCFEPAAFGLSMGNVAIQIFRNWILKNHQRMKSGHLSFPRTGQGAVCGSSHAWGSARYLLALASPNIMPRTHAIMQIYFGPAVRKSLPAKRISGHNVSMNGTESDAMWMHTGFCAASGFNLGIFSIKG